MYKIYLNDTVKVKLNDFGKDIYYHRFDDLIATMNKKGIKPIERRFPKVDEDGYTKFQLWCFIELYGPYIGMCKPNFLEDLNIYFDEIEEEG